MKDDEFDAPCECVNYKGCTESEYKQGKKDGRTEAEAEHKEMCASCIHKVSKADIDAIRISTLNEVIEGIEGCKYCDPETCKYYKAGCSGECPVSNDTEDFLVAWLKGLKEGKNDIK